ncbi:MAG: hypothetical protein JWM47_1655 [Acidimicrobiales bacterium]|nr:hypothetical protein [Acidimicrobiales bacterium]
MIVGRYRNPLTASGDRRDEGPARRSQGSLAYADQFGDDHPDQDQMRLRADAVLAVNLFCDSLLDD